MNELTVFDFQSEQSIRVVTDEENHPWFVAADVCAVLGINTEQTRRLDADEKVLRLIQTLGGEQLMVTVNEPGLYRLIFSSRKPEVAAFKRWVFHDVLPAIARQGFYGTPQLANFQESYVRMAQLQSEFEYVIKRLEKRVKKLEAITEMKPTVSEYMSINSYRVTVGLPPLGVAELMKALPEAEFLSKEQGYGTHTIKFGASFGGNTLFHTNVLRIMFPADLEALNDHTG